MSLIERITNYIETHKEKLMELKKAGKNVSLAVLASAILITSVGCHQYIKPNETTNSNPDQVILNPEDDPSVGDSAETIFTTTNEPTITEPVITTTDTTEQTTITTPEQTTTGTTADTSTTTSNTTPSATSTSKEPAYTTDKPAQITTANTTNKQNGNNEPVDLDAFYKSVMPTIDTKVLMSSKVDPSQIPEIQDHKSIVMKASSTCLTISYIGVYDNYQRAYITLSIPGFAENIKSLFKKFESGSFTIDDREQLISLVNNYIDINELTSSNIKQKYIIEGVSLDENGLAVTYQSLRPKKIDDEYQYNLIYVNKEGKEEEFTFTSPEILSQFDFINESRDAANRFIANKTNTSGLTQ